MHKKILRPLAMTLGLGLLPACPAAPGTTSDTDTDTSTSEDSSSDPSDPTVQPTQTTQTTDPPTTSEPTTGPDPDTSSTTVDPTATGSSTTDPTTETSTGETLDGLCLRLGGPVEGGIQDLVGGFLGVVVADERINGYFLNSDVDAGNLLAMVTAQLGVAAECPNAEYTGKDMVAAHQGLGISQQDFNDFAEDFQAALDDHQGSHPDLTDDDKIAIMDVLAGMAGDIVEDPDNNATVYQRVGRKPAIKQVIGSPDDLMSFIGIVVLDDAINGFFGMTDVARLNTCLTRQVSSIDGPIKYGAEVDSPAPGVDEGVSSDMPCRDMVSAHEMLQDEEMTTITFDDFAALVADLITAMGNFGVAADDQTAIFTALGPLCDQIVVTNFEKNRCPGNNKEETVEAGALAQALKEGMYDGKLESMQCQELVVAEDADGIGFVGDVRLKFGADHSWLGDLTLKVVSPAGTILTVMNRPGGPALPDNGQSCCGDNSNLSKDFPLIFRNGGANDPAAMGKTLNAMQIVCKDDGQCEFKPNHGLGPGVDFSDFLGESSVGSWQVCVGDSGDADPGMIDYVGLTFTKVKLDPKL